MEAASTGREMGDSAAAANAPLCPSAQPNMAGSVVFGVIGVIGGTAREPQVGYLVAPIPVTETLLAIADPLKPTKVFRFAAPCAGPQCQHFDGSHCRLAQQVTQMLPVVVDILPPCRIRPQCRWWQQEGKAACLRCPQIVTEVQQPSELLTRAATPQAGK